MPKADPIRPLRRQPLFGPRGRLWPMDAQGLLANDGDPERVDPIFSIAIRQGVSAFQRNLKDRMHSCYVTGSVARGLAVPCASDVHLHAVLRPGRTLGGPSAGWLAMASGVASTGQMAARTVRLHAHGWSAVFPGTDRFCAPAFLLATTGVCVAGEDITGRLPRPRLGAAIANGPILGFEALLSMGMKTVTTASGPAAVRESAVRTAGDALRACGALVLLEEEAYTDDPDLCADLFLLRHPEHRADVTDCYRLWRQPERAPDMALAVFERLRAWAVPMANRWLDRHNPDRLPALPVTP